MNVIHSSQPAGLSAVPIDDKLFINGEQYLCRAFAKPYWQLHGESSVFFEYYKVERRTPCGYWINDEENRRRWCHKDGRYASETKSDAIYRLKMRTASFAKRSSVDLIRALDRLLCLGMDNKFRKVLSEFEHTISCMKSVNAMDDNVSIMDDDRATDGGSIDDRSTDDNQANHNEQ